MKMERMRQAILQGLPKDVPFAKPGLPMNMPAQYGADAYSSYPSQPYGDPYCTQGFGGGMYQRQGGMNMRPAGSVLPPQGAVRGRGRGRGLLGRVLIPCVWHVRYIYYERQCLCVLPCFTPLLTLLRCIISDCVFLYKLK